MELRQILARVDELKAQIDALRPIQPEQEQRILQKFRLDWNYHSNAIEGNSLTLGETRAFLLEGLTAKGKPFKDHLDIRGHNQLILFLEDFVRQKEILTEAAIREMHKILLVEPYQVQAHRADGQISKKWVQLGTYKTEPNAVQTGTGEWLYFARPEDTAPRMAELVAWYRQQVETHAEHPLLVATLFHHRFTSIHPFDDGNGRMARALMNVILMREGFPPAVLKTEKRAEYVAALRKADNGDTGDLVDLVGANLIHSEELVLRGAKGESVEEVADLNKEIVLLKQELLGKLTLEKSEAEARHRRFQSVVKPLFQRILARTAPFAELFETVTFRIGWFDDTKGVPRYSSEHTSLTDALGGLAWLPPHKLEKLRTLTVTVVWSNLKKVGEEVPLSALTMVSKGELGPHGFAIDFGKERNPIEFSYDEPVDVDRLDKELSAVTKELLEQVRSQVRQR